MEASYHRHDINDKVWELLEPHLPGQRGLWGGILRITAVLSTQFFGYCEPGRPGVTRLPITGSGAVFIRGSSVGVEMVCQSESLLQKVPERIVKKLST